MHGRTLRRLAAFGLAAALSILTLAPAMPGLLAVTGAGQALAASAPLQGFSLDDLGTLGRATAARAGDPAEGDTVVGAIAGSLSVGQDGSANYTIPIKVPPGTNGAAPSLALTYNSNSGNGVLGIGWSISGLSSITRCPATPVLNGTKSEGGLGHRGVRYDKDDRYCLDGMQLKLAPDAGPDTYGQHGSRYQPAINGGPRPRITAMGNCGIDQDNPDGRGPCAFKVEHPDGSIDYYGATGDLTGSNVRDYSDSYGEDPSAWEAQEGAVKNGSQLPVNSEAPDAGALFDQVMHKTVRQWNLARTVDPHGNYVDYIYTIPVRISTQDDEGALVGQSYIWEIRYTRNQADDGLDHSRRVKFHYSFHHGPEGFQFSKNYPWHGITSYAGGYPVSHSGAAMTGITTSVRDITGWRAVRTYSLTYDADEGDTKRLQHQRGIRLFAVEVCAEALDGTECLSETRLTWTDSEIAYVRDKRYQLPGFLTRLTARDTNTKASGDALSWLGMTETLAWLTLPFLPTVETVFGPLELGTLAVAGLMGFDAAQAFSASPIGPHFAQTWLNSVNHPGGRENISSGRLLDMDGDGYLDFMRPGGTLSTSFRAGPKGEKRGRFHELNIDEGTVVYGGPDGFTGGESDPYPWVRYPHTFAAVPDDWMDGTSYAYEADKHRTVDFYKRAQHGVIIDVDSDGRRDYVDENGVIHYNGGRGNLNVPGKVRPLERMENLEEFMPLAYWRQTCAKDPDYWLCTESEDGARSKAPAPGQLFTYFHVHGRNLDDSNWSAVEYPLATLVDVDGDGLKDWVETTCSWGVRTRPRRTPDDGRYYRLQDRKRLLGNVFGPIYRDWGIEPAFPEKSDHPYYDQIDPNYATLDTDTGKWQVRRCAVYRQVEPRRFSESPDFYLPGPLFTYALYPWIDESAKTWPHITHHNTLIPNMYEAHMPSEVDADKVDGKYDIRVREQVIINRPARLVDMDGDGIPDYCYVAKSSGYWNLDLEAATGVIDASDDGNFCHRGLGTGGVADIGFEPTPFLHFKAGPEEPYLYLSTGTGARDAALDYGSWNPRQLIDMNGDGWLDVVETECTLGHTGCRIFLNTGRQGETAFIYAGNLPGPLAHSPDELDLIARAKATGRDVELREYKQGDTRTEDDEFIWALGFLLDVNGDHLPDWTAMRNCTNKAYDPDGIQWCDVHLNQGHLTHSSDKELFSKAISVPLPKLDIDPEKVPDVFESNVIAGALYDVDGDGFMDIAPAYCVQTPFADLDPVFNSENKWRNWDWTDFYRCASGGTRDTYLSTLRHSRIEAIDNGAGKTLRVEYRPSSDPEIFEFAYEDDGNARTVLPGHDLVFKTHTRVSEHRYEGGGGNPVTTVEQDYATRYHYSGYRVSRKNGLLGFETITSWSVDGDAGQDGTVTKGSGRGSMTTYSQEFPFIGAARHQLSFVPPRADGCGTESEEAPTGACLQLPDGSLVVPVSESYTTMTASTVAGSGGGAEAEKVWLAYQTGVTSTDHAYGSFVYIPPPAIGGNDGMDDDPRYQELGQPTVMPRRTVRHTVSHDELGFVEESISYGPLCGAVDTDGDGQTDTDYHCDETAPVVRTSSGHFRPDGDSWLWLPNRTEVYVDGERRRLSIVEFTEAEDGLQCEGVLGQLRHIRTTAASLDDSGDDITSAHRLDCYGNVVWKQAAPDAAAGERGAETTVTYDDAVHTFPVTTRIGSPGSGAGALESTHTFDLATGNVLSTTSPNGGIQTFRYDAFGRLLTHCGTDPNRETLQDSRTAWEKNLAAEACNQYPPDSTVPLLLLSRVERFPADLLRDGTVTASMSLTRRAENQGVDPRRLYSLGVALQDALGRPVVSLHRYLPSADAREFASAVQYDDLGRSYRHALPFEFGEVPSWASADYDYLGRTVEQRTPVLEGGGEAVATTSYELDRERNLVVESWLNKGSRWFQVFQGRHVVDVHGRTIREQSPPDTADTIHEYNELGQLTKTIDPVGATTTYRYDSLGRVVHTEDTNTGVHSVLEFDAFGKPALIERNGERIRMERDAYARVIRKEIPLPRRGDDPDVTGNTRVRVVKYLYGEPGNGTDDVLHNRVGRLRRVETWLGDPDEDDDARLALAKEFDYTVGGAVAERRLEFGPGALGGQDYAGLYRQQYRYTVDGQLQSIIYPDGTSVSMRTNDDGFLDRIWWDDNPYHDPELAGEETTYGADEPVIRYQDYNLLGEPGTMIYGNGLVEERRYNPLSGLLTYQGLTDPDGNDVQNRLYQWNVSHQLYKRMVSYNDGLSVPSPGTTTEWFDHDLVGRLTSVAENSLDGHRPTGQYSYNSTGDLTTKLEADIKQGVWVPASSDKFSLEPDSHRIETITDIGGNVTEVSYDANGNLVGKTPTDGTEWRYLFDAENRLLEVQKRQRSSEGHDSGSIVLVRTAPPWVTVGEYQYDESGQRVRKVEHGDDGRVSMTDYVSKYFEISHESIATLRKATTTDSLCTKYVHGIGGIVQQVTERSIPSVKGTGWASADTPCSPAPVLAE